MKIEILGGLVLSISYPVLYSIRGNILYFKPANLSGGGKKENGI